MAENLKKAFGIVKHGSGEPSISMIFHDFSSKCPFCLCSETCQAICSGDAYQDLVELTSEICMKLI
jgi:hypothetical protein